ncbi:putative transcription initiation factor lef-5 [Chelonus insularis]|nr:putative transcription initiation factor lef-5 [Chelonus insularis]
MELSDDQASQSTQENSANPAKPAPKKAKRKWSKKLKNDLGLGSINDKLNVLRRLPVGLLNEDGTDGVGTSTDEPKKGDTMLIMDNYACRIFDIVALEDYELPDFNPDELIDINTGKFSSCEHIFRLVSQQTRSADEINTIIKICEKCNAVFNS